MTSGPERFGFGDNWSRFLDRLTEERIGEARRSLVAMLGSDQIAGKTFLDVGCGSGLFSLAAFQLGARHVRSFDYDEHSVSCAEALRAQYGDGSDRWTVERGDILDEAYVTSLGTWDIVYSWGVLHHTGDMWRAIQKAALLPGARGQMFISIYNDQGIRSRVWRHVKRTYNRAPQGLRPVIVGAVMLPREALSFLAHTAKGRPHDYLRSWSQYRRKRGMSRWHDMVDWVGGYPFEVAAPDAVFRFLSANGFTLSELMTCGGSLGCNQFVFQRSQTP